MPAENLEPHPDNWRTHGDNQKSAIRAILADIGYAAPIIARPIDGKPDHFQIIDGHLRHEESNNEPIPVAVVDLNDEETKKLLLTFDPISQMAGENTERLSRLMKETRLPEDLHEVIENTRKKALKTLHAALRNAKEGMQLADVTDRKTVYQLIVELPTEEKQQELYEELAKKYPTKLIVT